MTPEPRRHEERLECANCGAYITHRCLEVPAESTPPRLTGPGSTPQGRARARAIWEHARRRQEPTP